MIKYKILEATEGRFVGHWTRVRSDKIVPAGQRAVPGLNNLTEEKVEKLCTEHNMRHFRAATE